MVAVYSAACLKQVKGMQLIVIVAPEGEKLFVSVNSHDMELLVHTISVPCIPDLRVRV